MKSRFTFDVSRLTLYALILLTIAWAPLPQSDETPVVGQVTNGSAGGTVPADLPVVLHVFSGMEETGTYTTTLTADNTFRFDGLTLADDDLLMVRVVYQDVEYVSDLVPAVPPVPKQQEIVLPVAIYETTDDLSDIQITQAHLFVTVAGDRVQVGEYRLVGNTGNRTFVGVEDPETGQRTTLHVTLPAEAEALQFDGPGLGERFVEEGDGFADTEPIPPGDVTVKVLFSYELAYREGMRIERTFDVPAASVVILLSAEGLALEGGGVVPGGVMDTQMGPALSYTAGPLAAGEPLAFKLVTGPPQSPPVARASAPAGSPPARNTARETSIGMAALAAAVAAVYWMYRSPSPGPIPARARPLVEKIAALDADFEAGRVTEKTYLKKRKALKQQARANLLKE